MSTPLTRYLQHRGKFQGLNWVGQIDGGLGYEKRIMTRQRSTPYSEDVHFIMYYRVIRRPSFVSYFDKINLPSTTSSSSGVTVRPGPTGGVLHRLLLVVLSFTYTNDWSGPEPVTQSLSQGSLVKPFTSPWKEMSKFDVYRDLDNKGAQHYVQTLQTLHFRVLRYFPVCTCKQK